MSNYEKSKQKIDLVARKVFRIMASHEMSVKEVLSMLTTMVRMFQDNYDMEDTLYVSKETGAPYKVRRANKETQH